MTIVSFVKINKNRIGYTLLFLVLIILGYVLYKYLWPKYNKDDPKRVCLDKQSQEKIASDIDKKLQEINACDCSETCGIKPNQPVNNDPAIETFGNDDFY